MQNQDFVAAIEENNICPMLGRDNNAPHPNELPFSEDGCFLRLRRLFFASFLLPGRARSNGAFPGSWLVVDEVSGIDWFSTFHRIFVVLIIRTDGRVIRIFRFCGVGVGIGVDNLLVRRLLEVLAVGFGLLPLSLAEDFLFFLFCFADDSA